LGSFVAFSLILVSFVMSMQKATENVTAAAQRTANSHAAGQAQSPAGSDFLLTMIATQEKLASQDPNNAVAATSLATFYHLHANSVRDQGNAQDALVWYGKAVSTLEPFLKKEPRLVQVREALKKNHSDRAEALTRLARHAEALSDRERALELDTWPDHSELRLQRALALVRLGQHAKATAEADALASAKELKGETLYTLARVYALSVAAMHRDGQKGLPPPQAEREQQLERRGAAAVKLLAEAEAAGHFKSPANLQDLRDHEDFNSLRARADFKTLLNDIQANVKTNTK
jgi:tetratricopeptide (TPR) repeat protein